MPALQALDLSYLHAVSGGDKAFEMDMLQSMLSEMNERMTALQTAVHTNDTSGIRMQAHSLKNLAGIIGVPSLAENFKGLEASAETAPNVYLLQQFIPCQSQWEQVKGLLEQHLEE